MSSYISLLSQTDLILRKSGTRSKEFVLSFETRLTLIRYRFESKSSWVLIPYVLKDLLGLVIQSCLIPSSPHTLIERNVVGILSLLTRRQSQVRTVFVIPCDLSSYSISSYTERNAVSNDTLTRSAIRI